MPKIFVVGTFFAYLSYIIRIIYSELQNAIYVDQFFAFC